jgi:hypothetical protein
MDAFTAAYVEAALWSSTGTEGVSLDREHDVCDLAPETLAGMVADCASFQEAYGELIAGEEARAGHDFWLTRNGHGAGFWDGDWPAGAGKRLTEASHSYGPCELYVGDDGRVWAS